MLFKIGKTLFILFVLFLGENSGPAKKENNAPSVRLEWDQKTLTKVSSSSHGERFCGYARLVQLANYELICVYESDGNIVNVRSRDEGKKWSLPNIIAPKKPEINMAAPDILKLSDGSLLVMYNHRPSQTDPSRRFGICVRKSVDNGVTWGAEQVLYQAGYRFENGCWEPSAIQLPDGVIQLFFANEGVYTHSNDQNISLLRSDDGGESWTTDPKIISFKKNSRDGMPVPLLLKNLNKIAIAIENNSYINFKPYIITNTLSENWRSTVGANDKNRKYALAERVDDAVYAGAPYLRQLSTGETILSYQGTENRKSDSMRYADMKVTIGDKHASNFRSKSIPFRIPPDKSALWNSVSILSDDTIIALTTTRAFNEDGRAEVWMIKGHLRKSD